MVTGSFELVPDAAAQLKARCAPPTGDMLEDDSADLLRYASDYVPFTIDNLHSLPGLTNIRFSFGVLVDISDNCYIFLDDVVITDLGKAGVGGATMAGTDTAASPVALAIGQSLVVGVVTTIYIIIDLPESDLGIVVFNITLNFLTMFQTLAR